MQGAISFGEFERQAKCLAEASKGSSQVGERIRPWMPAPCCLMRPRRENMEQLRVNVISFCPEAVLLTGSIPRTVGMDMDIESCTRVFMPRMADPPPLACFEEAGGEEG